MIPNTYFSVVIPWESDPDRRSGWHPTDPKMAPLSRGCFTTEEQARLWASTHLPPTSTYSVRRYTLDGSAS